MIFKNHYYYLIASLPEIFFDSNPPFSVLEFKDILYEELDKRDRKLIDNYFFKFDNKNINIILNKEDSQLYQNGVFANTDITDLVSNFEDNQSQEKEEKESVEEYKFETDSKQKNIFPEYINEYFNEYKKDNKKNINDLYLNSCLKIKNTLISQWFEFNLNLENLLSAIYSSKYNIDIDSVLVGDNFITRFLKENKNARDFNISSLLYDIEWEWIEEIKQISLESNFYEREKKIDKFKWNWLEEKTTHIYSDVEYLFAFLCKIEILERWSLLHKDEGKSKLLNIVDSLKKETTISK